jgi:excisionase family DNA binding protein
MRAAEVAVPVVCPPRLLDLAGAAAYLGLSGRTIRELIASGALRRVRIPLPTGGTLRKIVLDREDLDRVVDRWKS